VKGEIADIIFPGEDETIGFSSAIVGENADSHSESLQTRKSIDEPWRRF